MIRNLQFINRNINRNIIRNYVTKPIPNINIFIRNAITQLKTKEEIEKTEEVVNSLFVILSISFPQKLVLVNDFVSIFILI